MLLFLKYLLIAIFHCVKTLIVNIIITPFRYGINCENKL